MSAEPPAFPKALDDDDDDVSWALQTARRAGSAEATRTRSSGCGGRPSPPLELGEFGRAADLEKSARQIDLWVKLSESSGLVQSEEDDGVDALLDGDMPMLETRALDGPTPSLVDAIEAEARGESPLGPDPEELDDVVEVEELEDEEIIEELPESAMVETGGDAAPLPSFALDSVPPPAPEEEAIDVVTFPSFRRSPSSSRSRRLAELEPLAEPEPMAEPEPFPEPATETRLKSETGHAIEKKPSSSPLVAVEPEPMPPVPLRESRAAATAALVRSRAAHRRRRGHAQASCRSARVRARARARGGRRRDPPARCIRAERRGDLTRNCAAAERAPDARDRSRPHRVRPRPRRSDARDPRRARSTRTHEDSSRPTRKSAATDSCG